MSVMYGNEALQRDMASVRWLETYFLPSGHHTTLLIFIDNRGSAIVPGVVCDFTIHFPAALTGWTLLADQVGSAVVDIWKADYSAYPPSAVNSIIKTGGVKPTLASAIKNRGFTVNDDLKDWDRQIAPGDTFRFNVDSASIVTRLHLSLAMHKPPKT